MDIHSAYIILLLSSVIFVFIDDNRANKWILFS